MVLPYRYGFPLRDDDFAMRVSIIYQPVIHKIHNKTDPFQKGLQVLQASPM